MTLQKYIRITGMHGIKIAGLILVVAGVLGLTYKTFTYTKESHQANIGPLEFSVKDKETVNVPAWASIGAIAAGTLMLIYAGRPK